VSECVNVTWLGAGECDLVGSGGHGGKADTVRCGNQACDLFSFKH
jgi:hypothetical protein